MNQKKYASVSEVLIKVASYCAYQERCHKEVLEKLSSLGVYGEEANKMLLRLIEDNYVNEERFAKAFAGGKFRVKQWGKQKIKKELKFRDISDYCIQMALKEIEPEEYDIALRELISKKYQSVKALNELQRKYKTAQYAISKGFEGELVWDVLQNLEAE